MIPSFDQIIKSIEQLPEAEQVRIRRWLEEKGTPNGEDGSQAGVDRSAKSPITLEKTHNYSTLKPGITLTATLHHGQESVECEARLDTGSSHCIFMRAYGELLGLDIESSVPDKIATVTGSFQAYPHTITIEVLGIRSDATVYFAADDHFTRSVLGRTGWLDRVKLGLIDYDAKLLLSPYF